MQAKLSSKNRRSGFTLLEIIIVVTIIGLIAGIALPNWLYARQESRTNCCVNNLRQIDTAKAQWAIEAGKRNSATPTTDDLVPYLGRGFAGSAKGIYCPLGDQGDLKGYAINIVADPPQCVNFNDKIHPAVFN
jgi:prepilin-type N-terminal cleavage/methylation domain-containing protein